MKKFFSIVLLLIIFLMGGCAVNQKVNKTENESLLLEVRNVNEETKFNNISVEYPVFPQSSVLSKEIEDYIKSKIALFKKNSQENWKARVDTASEEDQEKKQGYPNSPFILRTTWSGKQLNTKYVSFVLRSSSFEGGANSNNEIKVFNFNIQENKSVNLAEVFLNKKNYLEKISEVSRVDLKQQLASENIEVNVELQKMFEEGTAPKEENFRNFNFDKNGVVFYFSQYQLGPRNFGERTVDIDYAMIP